MFDAKKFIQEINLKNKQRIVDKKYQEQGLTDEVLELQLEINKARSEHDLPDKNDLNDDGFCQ